MACVIGCGVRRFGGPFFLGGLSMDPNKVLMKDPCLGSLPEIIPCFGHVKNGPTCLMRAQKCILLHTFGVPEGFVQLEKQPPTTRVTSNPFWATLGIVACHFRPLGFPGSPWRKDPDPSIDLESISGGLDCLRALPIGLAPEACSKLGMPMQGLQHGFKGR